MSPFLNISHILFLFQSNSVSKYIICAITVLIFVAFVFSISYWKGKIRSYFQSGVPHYTLQIILNRESLFSKLILLMQKAFSDVSLIIKNKTFLWSSELYYKALSMICTNILCLYICEYNCFSENLVFQSRTDRERQRKRERKTLFTQFLLN